MYFHKGVYADEPSLSFAKPPACIGTEQIQIASM